MKFRKKLKIFTLSALLISTFTITVPSASAAPLCDGKVPVNSCIGATSDGAPYAMQVPANFNGTLIIYSHGYRPNVNVIEGIPGYGGYKVTNTPETAPGQSGGDLTVTNYLLSKGYALAGSGFSRQGWNADSALLTNKELIDTFKAKFTTTKNVMAWGQSLGGIITQLMQEKYPDLLTAAAPLCVADNLNAELKMAGDFLWGFKVLFDPSIKAGNYSAGPAGYSESMLDLVKVFTVINKLQAKIATNDWPDTASDLGKQLAKDGVSARSALLMIGLMAGVPTQSAHFDASTGPKGPNELLFAVGVSPALAVLENGASAAALAILATHDVELQVGGSVFDNTKTNYANRVTFSSVSFANALGGATGISKLLQAIAAAPRVSANPAAVAKLNTLAATTGKVNAPTIIMTGVNDPITPAGAAKRLANLYAEQYAAEKATAFKNFRAKGYIAPLKRHLVIWSTSPTSWTTFDDAGLPISSTPAAPGTGHCNFTSKQYLAVADLMIKASKNGYILKDGPTRTLIRKAGNLSISDASYVELLKFYTDN